MATLICAGLALSTWGTWRIIASDHAEVTSSEHVELSVCEPPDERVVIDISGGVVLPGVYELTAGSRVADALSAAGGLSEFADYQYITQTMNLAQSLSDAQKIHVPVFGEKEVTTAQSTTEPGIDASIDAQQLVAKTSINSAGQSTLEELPGIGEKRAEAIIEGRPYGSLNELVTSGVVTQKIFDEIVSEIQL